MKLQKPKVGLAGVMSTPFRGDKEGNFRKHREALEALARELNVELRALEQGIYTQEGAEHAAGTLGNWGADFVLLQTSSFAAGGFLYPFTDQDFRLGLWAVPEGEPSSEGGLPLNSFTAANMYNSIIKTRRPHDVDQVKWFYGHPDDPLFRDRLEATLRALRALINLPGKRVGLLGGVAPGFDNLIVDPGRLHSQLGMEMVEISFENVLERARDVDGEKAQATAREIRESAESLETSQGQALRKSARVVRAVQELMDENELSAAAISCWPRFQTDYDLAICSVMGHLNNLGTIAACEGDVTSAVSMLALRALTDGAPVTLMDLVSLDRNDGSVLLWHCGPTPPSLANSDGVRMESLWLFDDEQGKKTGLHNDLVLRPGPATVVGFTVDYQNMLVLEGVVDDQKPSYRGSRGWLKDLRLNGREIDLPDLVETLMHSGFQHHYPLAYGRLSAAALELASWLRISPLQKTDYTDHLS